MNPLQLREFIIDPVLHDMGLYSKAASDLVLGTAAQETLLGEYIDQLSPGPGPAYGIYQMEQATHNDIWENFLRYKPQLADIIRRMRIPYLTEVPQLRGNLYYATAMCRVHYYRVKEPLPLDGDINGLGRYWKKYYNTMAGKGTVEEFIDNYMRLVVGKKRA